MERGQRRLNGSTIVGLYVNSAYLFAAPQSSGVWRRPLSELIVTDVKDQPESHRPISHSIKITPIHLIQSQRLSMRCQETTKHSENFQCHRGSYGKIVSTEQGAGKHLAEFSAERLQSGIYYYQTVYGTLFQRKENDCAALNAYDV